MINKGVLGRVHAAQPRPHHGAHGQVQDRLNIFVRIFCEIFDGQVQDRGGQSRGHEADH